MELTLTDPRRITTWTALRRSGLTADHIRAQLDAGRWRRWGYAIALHNGPLSTQQRWFVARVSAGPRALLTAFTAAEAFGLTGWQRAEVHVLVPRGGACSARSPVQVRLHRRRDWTSVRRHGGSGVHEAADALLLAASTFRSPRPACGLLAASVQQRIVTVDALVAALELHPRLRHRAALGPALADIGQGSQALSEIDFVRLCRRFGLPGPEQQRVRRQPDGRRRYLDAIFRRHDGRRVVVEVDGAMHLGVERWWDDQSRQNEISIGESTVLRFPSVIVREQPGVVADQLGRALHIAPTMATR